MHHEYEFQTHHLQLLQHNLLELKILMKLVMDLVHILKLCNLQLHHHRFQ